MTTWTEKTEQDETWTASSSPSSSWTENTEQSETWASQARNSRPRVFSPLVFAPWPVFATGVLSDFWTEKTEQPETWTAA
jgi:hypothetical protein